jgi:uncharacterized membrane protein YcaP (DUF421 family)
MQEEGIPLHAGLLPILVVLGMELSLSGIIMRSVKLRKFLCGKPVILIENGKILQENLRATRVNLDELAGHLREKDVLDISSVQYAILETNANLSVFPYPKDRPASAKDAGIRAKAQSLPVTIIEDGYISHANLAVAGKDLRWLRQVLNGNQVLGYCRVRYVPTANGTQNDFGSTERQRTVLTKLFEKYKDTNIFTLVSVLNDCLPLVLTDISKADMQDLMETVVENRILNLVNYRIPVSGTYDSAKVGGADVIIVRWAKNIEALHNKIFGDTE